MQPSQAQHMHRAPCSAWPASTAVWHARLAMHRTVRTCVPLQPCRACRTLRMSRQLHTNRAAARSQSPNLSSPSAIEEPDISLDDILSSLSTPKPLPDTPAKPVPTTSGPVQGKRRNARATAAVVPATPSVRAKRPWARHLPVEPVRQQEKEPEEEEDEEEEDEEEEDEDEEEEQMEGEEEEEEEGPVTPEAVTQAPPTPSSTSGKAAWSMKPTAQPRGSAATAVPASRSSQATAMTEASTGSSAAVPAARPASTLQPPATQVTAQGVQSDITSQAPAGEIRGPDLPLGSSTQPPSSRSQPATPQASTKAAAAAAAAAAVSRENAMTPTASVAATIPTAPSPPVSTNRTPVRGAPEAQRGAQQQARVQQPQPISAASDAVDTTLAVTSTRQRRSQRVTAARAAAPSAPAPPAAPPSVSPSLISSMTRSSSKAGPKLGPAIPQKLSTGAQQQVPQRRAAATAARRAANATPRTAYPPDPVLLSMLFGGGPGSEGLAQQGVSMGSDSGGSTSARGAPSAPTSSSQQPQRVVQRGAGTESISTTGVPSGHLSSQHQHPPSLQDPIDSYNWYLHAEVAAPEVYDPGYHTTLYEFLFDLWPALGKAHAQGRASLVSSCYEFLEGCWSSPEPGVARVTAVALAEGLGDNDALQEAAADHITNIGLLHAVLCLVKLLHPDELRRGGLVHEFVLAAERTLRTTAHTARLAALSTPSAAAGSGSPGNAPSSSAPPLATLTVSPSSRSSSPSGSAPVTASAGSPLGSASGAASAKGRRMLRAAAAAAADQRTHIADVLVEKYLQSGGALDPRASARPGSSTAGTGGCGEWEALVRKLERLKDVHPAATLGALACVMEDYYV